MPLLEGLDGVRKMSKSLDNYVGITEPPDEQFGKLMSIPDELIVKYLRLCAPLDPREVDEVERGLADGSMHPNEQKRRMARLIVDLYHGEGAGAGGRGAVRPRAQAARASPTTCPRCRSPMRPCEDGRVWLPRLLVATGLAASNGEARRAVQGAACGSTASPSTTPTPSSSRMPCAARCWRSAGGGSCGSPERRS